MYNNENDVFKVAENVIANSSMTEQEKISALKEIQSMKSRKINLMITGATGCGKSSTINALFNCQRAKVGTTANPETMQITKYELDNMVLWDSPGLGDGKEADIEHSKKIIDLLHQKDDDGDALIDLVLVILDGQVRDLGTSFELINQVIIPNLGESASNRILVAINKCDMAMSGRNWDFEANKPQDKLVDFLNDKAASVRRRIKEGTNVDVETIYYAAGYKEDDSSEQSKPYNLSKLLYYIIQHTPKQKRLVYVNNISRDANMWKDSDELMDYREEVQKSFLETLVDGIGQGANTGKLIGNAIGGPVIGVIGGFIGGAAGGVVSIGKKIIGSIFRF